MLYDAQFVSERVANSVFYFNKIASGRCSGLKNDNGNFHLPRKFRTLTGAHGGGNTEVQEKKTR